VEVISAAAVDLAAIKAAEAVVVPNPNPQKK
jgi:hypothetical protein